MRLRWLVMTVLVMGCQFDTLGSGMGSAQGAGSTGAGPTPSASASTTGSDAGDASDVSTSAPSPTAGSSTAGTDGSTGGDDPTLVGWCDPQWTDLVGCYALQQLDGGVLIDQSMHGHDGTVTGVEVVAGPLGEAARTSDGGTMLIPASGPLDLDATMSFEVWVYIDQLPETDRYGIMDRDGMYSAFAYPDGLHVGGRGENNRLFPTPPLGTWFHVGYTLGDAFSRLYIDGVLVDEAASVLPNGGAGNENPLTLGCSSPDMDQPLMGAVGGLRVWATERTAEQICAGAQADCG